jgi:cold shock protein
LIWIKERHRTAARGDDDPKQRRPVGDQPSDATILDPPRDRGRATVCPNAAAIIFGADRDPTPMPHDAAAVSGAPFRQKPRCRPLADLAQIAASAYLLARRPVWVRLSPSALGCERRTVSPDPTEFRSAARRAAACDQMEFLLMATGTVKWFNTQKGYGFIQPTSGGPDVFVHISAVERAGMDGLNEGQKISYELEQGQRGRVSAVNLRPA